MIHKEKYEEFFKEKDILFRTFIIIIGFGLAVSGGTTAIIYLNLIPIGYSYREYLHFISYRPECYLFPAGILIVWLAIYFPPDKTITSWKKE